MFWVGVLVLSGLAHSENDPDKVADNVRANCDFLVPSCNVEIRRKKATHSIARPPTVPGPSHPAQSSVFQFRIQMNGLTGNVLCVRN